MDEPIVVGIDIGTTKVCTLVARVEGERTMRILGVGIEPSQGIRKGNIVDLAAASTSIARSIEKAQRTSGFEITSALVSLAGSHVASVNSRGVVGISGGVIDEMDVARALEAAQAVAIPHNRQIIHVIQRSFIVDGQDGIRTPIGMHGYRMEVEAHIITAAESTVENLRQCVQAAGVQVTQFVLNPLASAEVVLSETERQMGAVVCDIGGGTTDIAIFIEGSIWHTVVLPTGGEQITNDIAIGLRTPYNSAEEIKIKYGHAQPQAVMPEEMVKIDVFGEDGQHQVPRHYLAEIIEARAEEIFELVLKEIKRSGYDGLLPAGLVLCGGTAQLPGLKDLARDVMGLPTRVGEPENLRGLVDTLHSPAFATSVGLLRWGISHDLPQPSQQPTRSSLKMPGWLKAFLPG